MDVMRLANEDIEANKTLATSIMPSGQVNVLQSRQDFLDLVGYLIEISEGGPATAAKLKPTQKELLAFSPSEDLNLDHSGIIRDWNKESYQRGQGSTSESVRTVTERLIRGIITNFATIC